MDVIGTIAPVDTSFRRLMSKASSSLSPTTPQFRKKFKLEDVLFQVPLISQFMTGSSVVALLQTSSKCRDMISMMLEFEWSEIQFNRKVYEPVIIWKDTVIRDGKQKIPQMRGFVWNLPQLNLPMENKDWLPLNKVNLAEATKLLPGMGLINWEKFQKKFHVKQVTVEGKSLGVFIGGYLDKDLIKEAINKIESPDFVSFLDGDLSECHKIQKISIACIQLANLCSENRENVNRESIQSMFPGIKHLEISNVSTASIHLLSDDCMGSFPSLESLSLQFTSSCIGRFAELENYGYLPGELNVECPVRDFFVFSQQLNFAKRANSYFGNLKKFHSVALASPDCEGIGNFLEITKNLVDIGLMHSEFLSLIPSALCRSLVTNSVFSDLTKVWKIFEWVRLSQFDRLEIIKVEIGHVDAKISHALENLYVGGFLAMVRLWPKLKVVFVTTASSTKTPIKENILWYLPLMSPLHFSMDRSVSFNRKIPANIKDSDAMSMSLKMIISEINRLS
jgi:hypothetical protein